MKSFGATERSSTTNPIPYEGLEVITNEEQAAPYFADLMDQHNVPGHVVVRSKQAEEDKN